MVVEAMQKGGLLDSFCYDAVILVKGFLCKRNSCSAFNPRIPISLMRWAGKVFVLFQFTVPFFWHPLHTKGAFGNRLHGATFSIRAGMTWDVFLHLLRYVGGVFPDLPCYGLECCPMVKTVLYFCPFFQCKVLRSCSSPLCFFPD